MITKSPSLLLLCFGSSLVAAEFEVAATSKPLEPWGPSELPREFIAMENNDENGQHLQLRRADVFVGRRRRAIDPSVNFLDDKAAEEIFGEESKWNSAREPGPPAPPDPVLYQQFAVAPSSIKHEKQQEAAIISQHTRYLPPTARVRPYDNHVDPNFPVEAPRARGLAPPGSVFVDAEFRTGYRWNAGPSSPSYHRTFEIGPRGRPMSLTINMPNPNGEVHPFFVQRGVGSYSRVPISERVGSRLH